MIFLTGANGLVGSFIARLLLSHNYSIRALRRKNSDMSLVADIFDRIEWIEGDLSDVQLLDKVIKDTDIVIHAAARIAFSKKYQEEMFKTNVEGTANVVNAALKNNVKRFCHISSIAALSRKKNTESINESAVWEESSNNTRYAESKYLSELEVWRGIEEGLEAFIVNPSIVIGPGDWNTGSSKIFKYVFDENLFYPKGEMNFIDVRDVADIVFRLLNSEVKGERFILNADKIAYKDIFKLMAVRFNKKTPGFEANTLMSEVAWRLEAITSFFRGKDPLLTKETVRASGQSFSYNNEKVKASLNYNFRDVGESVNWICDEFIGRYQVDNK
jgi:nucleoside-diphosphate-sugar epimerase